MDIYKLVMTTEKDCFQSVKSTLLPAVKLYGNVLSVYPVDIENDEEHVAIIWMMKTNKKQWESLLDVFIQMGRTITYCDGYYVT